MSMQSFWKDCGLCVHKALWTRATISVLCIHCTNIYLTSADVECGGILHSVALDPQWLSQCSSPSAVARGSHWDRLVVLWLCWWNTKAGASWDTATGHGVMGKAEIWEAARKRMRPRLRRLLPLAPALEKAESSASLQLSSLLPLSHLQSLFSCAENLFVLLLSLPMVAGGGREVGILFLIPPGAQPSLTLARSEL